MRNLTLEEAADFLESAQVDETFDHGMSIVHVGKDEAGRQFVLMNDSHGRTVLSVAGS